MRDFVDVGADLGLSPEELVAAGRHRARLAPEALGRLDAPANGREVLVTAMTPTTAGIGKTVTSIGLAMGLQRTGRRAVATLRQSSLGPTLGRKGGGAGGGQARIEPFEDALVGLGADLFAIEAATNLLAAAVDESIRVDEHDLDPESVTWKRCIDLDDRALRHIVVSARAEHRRTTGFIATAASEVMAVLSLAADPADLRQRLGRIVVGATRGGEPVTAEDLRAAGAMAVLLRDAAHPHLFQTTEGTPVLMHAGPYANLGTGNSSVFGDRLALRLADWVVTEGGFGSDLGGEKFLHLKRPHLGVDPSVAVLVCSVAAVDEHGVANLRRHVEHLAGYGVPIVVAVNRFDAGDDERAAPIREVAVEAGASAVVLHDAFVKGGAGCIELAEAVADVGAAASPSVTPRYHAEDTFDEKVAALATGVYGAAGVRWSEAARQQLERLTRAGLGGLPPCVAKTPMSLSHDPKLGATPEDFELDVVEIVPYVGAGYLVVRCGPIVALPGMPDEPRYQQMELAADGSITGLV
ncbi:MAG: formate--tetrahydrofolate ligase [Actinomycetota bacterium]